MNASCSDHEFVRNFLKGKRRLFIEANPQYAKGNDFDPIEADQKWAEFVAGEPLPLKFVEGTIRILKDDLQKIHDETEGIE